MTAPGLMHSVFFYRGEREYLDEVLPFVMDGVVRGEPVVVALPADKLALLRKALGEAVAGVDMLDMGKVGRNPANTFAMFAAALGAEHTGRRLWVVAEPVWPARTCYEYPACVQNEALYNVAFAGCDLVTVCPYDAAGLSADVLADARRTHPLIRRGGRDIPSADYGWQKAFDDYNKPLAADPRAASYVVAGPGDLSEARCFASDCAHAMGLSAERISDLHLIVTELATNSLNYSGTGCRLTLWRRAGELICEIRDGGRFEDRLAGRRPAAPNAVNGRGLLLVNALADLVRIHTSDTGTTIQASLPLGSAAVARI